jgi:hypothetical protein
VQVSSFDHSARASAYSNARLGVSSISLHVRIAHTASTPVKLTSIVMPMAYASAIVVYMPEDM